MNDTKPTPGLSCSPGEIIAAEGDIELNPGRERRTVRVENTGDRPVQVGSHFQFSDVNAALVFDRSAAVGFRLDVPAGTGVRFEPGIAREITLVALAGARFVPGLQRGKPDVATGGLSGGHPDRTTRGLSGGTSSGVAP